ncbi:hypothetical protein KC338_g2468 [Hortaea werneckii]|uniref:DNA-directed RNA polymerase III subunit RPC3 n=2 Tax=Hortaea werneckii TaxID=91943 RepID=A0A3M7GLI2_HORWE|nr:hypothetical protein KC323_g2626 [Hortaea werneckii]KAI6871650.1 hypothetical protein KC338_g2468 [Hortaea werneckii]KAI7356177.1 hypothetical protein KC320_g2369 [Hortaea werneckii]RMZ02026.1 hypothetical protein D0862_06173 [Hortaea werneckii]
MAQNLAELCTILIENQLGELSAQIFATLAEHGRLPIPTLAHHSGIPSRRVRTGLANLLEAQLVLHFAAEEDAPTFYSVNWRNAYNLARHTNIVELVNERFGERAGHLVGNILQLGHAKVGDLAEAYELAPGSKRDNGIDGTTNHAADTGMVNGAAKTNAANASQMTSANEFHGTLRALLRSGILVKVGMRAFMPSSDLQEQIEEMVIVDQFPDRKVTGPKKQAEFKQAVHILKRKWRDDDTYSDLHDGGAKGAVKRPGEHFQPSNKRIKLNGVPNGLDAANGEQEVQKLSNDLVVRVDFTRCVLSLRSRRLQQYAKRFMGGVSAEVYGALLQVLEGKSRSVRDELAPEDDEDEEEKLPVANISEVAEVLDPTIDLGATIKGLASSNGVPNGVGKHKTEADDGIKREDSDDEEKPNGFTSYRDRAKRMSLIEAHLSLLEEHGKSFCQRARAHNSNEWRVNFPALTSMLIEAELDNTVRDRFGQIALRIVRMLRDRGKLDEKLVASNVMMRVKDVRAILTQLQFHGILEAQELPKDNGRQPSRTLYLWFFDPKRVQSLVLQQSYKAMSRTLQRIPVERERYRTIIEKAERTDIKGHEQEKLEAIEKQMLREWREIEERLLAQVGRVDEIVALLRDFSGKDTSLVT